MKKLTELGEIELAKALDDSEQQSEDNIFDQMVQNVLFHNDKFCIEHDKWANTFSLRGSWSC